MGKSSKTGLAAGLLVLGGVASAFAKWYLVWLAQNVGGVDLLGIYGTVLAIVTPLFVAGQLGLRTIFLTMSESFPWKTYLLLRIAGIAVASILVLFIFSFSPTVSLTLGLAVISMKIVESSLDLDLARIQYSGRLVTVGVISLISAPISILLSTIGIVLTGSFEVAVLGASAAFLLVASIAWKQARIVDYKATVEMSGYRRVVIASIPVTGAQLLGSLLLYLPILVLSLTSDLKTVGIYTGVAYVLTAADLLGSSLAKFLITPLKRARESAGTDRVIAVSHRLTFQFAGVGLLGGGIFVIFGSSIFKFIYGDEFHLSYVDLTLFAIASIFILLAYIQSVSLNVLNMYVGVAMAFAIACAISFLVGAVLVAVSVEGLIVGAAMAAVGAFTRFFVLRFAVGRSRK